MMTILVTKDENDLTNGENKGSKNRNDKTSGNTDDNKNDDNNDGNADVHHNNKNDDDEDKVPVASLVTKGQRACINNFSVICS